MSDSQSQVVGDRISLIRSRLEAVLAKPGQTIHHSIRRSKEEWVLKLWPERRPHSRVSIKITDREVTLIKIRGYDQQGRRQIKEEIARLNREMGL